MTRSLKSRTRRSSGLTLIELLVVLTILIALGGIVVSSLPGLLSKTQSATAAANVPEIDAAIRRNLVANGTLGNRFDALVTSSSGASGDVASYVGGSEYFQAVSLGEEEIEALNELGLSELVPASATPADATFDSHNQQPVPLATDTKACTISSAFVTEIMERIWNLTPDEDEQFLVFGLGSRSTLVGGSETALFPEAPVHFSNEASSSPKNMYSRYLIVVELKSNPDGATRARYVGVAIPDARGLRGIGQELQDVYTQGDSAL